MTEKAKKLETIEEDNGNFFCPEFDRHRLLDKDSDSDNSFPIKMFVFYKNAFIIFYTLIDLDNLLRNLYGFIFTWKTNHCFNCVKSKITTSEIRSTHITRGYFTRTLNLKSCPYKIKRITPWVGLQRSGWYKTHQIIRLKVKVTPSLKGLLIGAEDVEPTFRPQSSAEVCLNSDGVIYI